MVTAGPTGCNLRVLGGVPYRSRELVRRATSEEHAEHFDLERWYVRHRYDGTGDLEKFVRLADLAVTREKGVKQPTF